MGKWWKKVRQGLRLLIELQMYAQFIAVLLARVEAAPDEPLELDPGDRQALGALLRPISKTLAKIGI